MGLKIDMETMDGRIYSTKGIKNGPVDTRIPTMPHIFTQQIIDMD